LHKFLTPAQTEESITIMHQASEAAAPEIVGQIEIHVGCRLGGRLRDFRLLVRDHGLVLQGHAQTYYAKQLAQHAVMEVTDLPIRANEIAVGSVNET
jgi:hypothetical protein